MYLPSSQIVVFEPSAYTVETKFTKYDVGGTSHDLVPLNHSMATEPFL